MATKTQRRKRPATEAPEELVTSIITNNPSTTIFSSDLFSNLIVRKTASAEVPEGALGATVDLNAQRPFDAGNRTVISAQGSYNDLAERMTPGVTALFSRKLFDGKLGILLSAAYDATQRILYLRFRSGDVYRYFYFSQDDYQNFLAAESKGRHFFSPIRNRFPYYRMAKLQVA